MKREFSKMILAAVMLLYFAGAVYGGIIVAVSGYGLDALLAYIGAPTATAIGFYAWKAKAENVVKLKKSAVETIEEQIIDEVNDNEHLQ